VQNLTFQGGNQRSGRVRARGIVTAAQVVPSLLGDATRACRFEAAADARQTAKHGLSWRACNMGARVAHLRAQSRALYHEFH
jgi:hypothetical protein